LPRYRCSNAIVGWALIAAAAISLPAKLHAQPGTPEVSPPIPGMSWGSPPVQGEWETTGQRDAAQGTAQGSAQRTAQDAQDHANAQVLIAQQVMAEQARRMAALCFGS
jgi:hypothetical protein